MPAYILNSEVLGSGDPVVFLPGMLATTSYWKNITTTLSKNFKTISLDLLGFGKSPKPNIEYTIEDHLFAIQNTLDNLETNEPFILVGHSMGGLLALEYTKKFPQKVKKLILIGTPIFYSKEEVKENISQHSSLHRMFLYGKIAKIICLIFCRFLRPFTVFGVIYFLKNLPKDIAKDTLLHTWHSYKGSLINIVENQTPLFDLYKIACPIYILYGEKDNRIKPQNLEKMLKFNDNITIKKFDSGHQLPLQIPEVIIDLISKAA